MYQITGNSCNRTGGGGTGEDQRIRVKLNPGVELRQAPFMGEGQQAYVADKWLAMQVYHIRLETLGYAWRLSLRWYMRQWHRGCFSLHWRWRGIHMAVARTIAGPIVLGQRALYQGCGPLVEGSGDPVTVDARVAPHTSASKPCMRVSPHTAPQ